MEGGGLDVDPPKLRLPAARRRGVLFELDLGRLTLVLALGALGAATAFGAAAAAAAATLPPCVAHEIFLHCVACQLAPVALPAGTYALLPSLLGSQYTIPYHSHTAIPRLVSRSPPWGVPARDASRA